MLMEKNEKEGTVRQLYRRLVGRERMTALLDTAQPMAERAELARLRDYLRQWAAYERGYAENLGIGSAEPLARQPTSAGCATDYLERADRWAMQVIEAAMDDLSVLPNGLKMRAALRLRYLCEGLERAAGVPLRVYRMHRLAGLSIEQVDRLADQAEEAMIPGVRRRGLPL